MRHWHHCRQRRLHCCWRVAFAGQARRRWAQSDAKADAAEIVAMMAVDAETVADAADPVTVAADVTVRVQGAALGAIARPPLTTRPSRGADRGAPSAREPATGEDASAAAAAAAAETGAVATAVPVDAVIASGGADAESVAAGMASAGADELHSHRPSVAYDAPNRCH